jgi:hypothetical protein
MPGPAPKPEEQRRNRSRPAGGAERWLPVGGRSGPAPVWPFGSQTKAQAELWSELWATPHAVAWEELGWVRTVARYCRLVLEAEKRDAKVTLLGEVRQMEDRLGLSPMAMLRLRWRIDADGVTHRAEDPAGGADVITPDRWRVS